MKVVEYGPDCISIITTYRCTAECKECCFECGPHVLGRISNEQIRNAIDQAIEMESVKFIVWTGGECTMLGDDLVKGIQYATDCGLPSRIVSNGGWARTDKMAQEFLKKLINAGLVELNISTGDNHQQFVKPDTAIRAAVTGAQMGISSVISVEKTNEAKFNPEDIQTNKIYKRFLSEGRNVDKFQVINPVWVSFHRDTKYGYKDNELDNPELRKGCDNIYIFIGVNPSGNYIGCCGLTMRYIPSMNLGSVDKISMKKAYDDQYHDFVKRWIFTEGALKILEQAKLWDEDIKIPRFPHNCLYCAYMYHDKKVQKVIMDNYRKVEDRINSEFESKIEWFKVRADKDILQLG